MKTETNNIKSNKTFLNYLINTKKFEITEEDSLRTYSYDDYEYFEEDLSIIFWNTMNKIEELSKNIIPDRKENKKDLESIIDYVSKVRDCTEDILTIELGFDTIKRKKFLFLKQELVSNFEVIIYTDYTFQGKRKITFPYKVLDLKLLS